MSEKASELSREELLRRYGKKSPRAVASTRRSPFKFLDSYDASDADIFFGRDAEIAELLRHFHIYGHVLIYGESGSGKSSLVQCGLRSRISETDALFVPLRIHATGLPGLCEQIRESVSIAIQQPLETAPASSLVDTLRIAGEAASRPIVLFFDQFEELFIFHDAQTRRRFADDLASIPLAKLNVKVMIGVRQDFLAQLSELEDVVEGLFDNRFWLRRMARENAVQAVVKACSTCDVKIDPQLADSILNRLDPNSLGIELPYLQVVMDRLYRQAVDDDPAHPEITAEKVEKLGNIANILGTFLIEEVEKLPSPDVGRQILKAFVTREKTRRTLDRAAVAQESAGFGAAIPPDVLAAHLNQLTSVRILREIADSQTYELRHDALAATVASWVSEVEKELIEVRDNFLNRFKEYEARGGQTSALLDQSFMDYLAIYRKRLAPLLNDEQSQFLQASEQRLRRVKRFRQIVTAGGIAAAFFIVIAGWMYVQYRDAKLAREKVTVAVDAVKTMMEEIDTLKDVPQTEGVRSVLLEQALKILEKIDDRDETGRYEKASIQYEVAQVHRILGSGDHAATAEAAYREAIDQFQELSTQFPGNSLYRQQLGLAHMWLGELFRVTGKDHRADDAMQQYNKAIEIQSQLAALADRNHHQYQIDLARSHMNRGIHHKNAANRKKEAHDLSGAEQAFADTKNDYDQAKKLLTEALLVVENNEQAEECQVLLSKTHSNRGVLLKSQLDKENLDQGVYSDARKSYVAALDELNKAIEKRRDRELPERLEYKLNLAMYHSNLANLLWKFDPAARNEAEDHNAEAVSLGQSLNVGTREVRMEVAAFYDNKAYYQQDEKPKQAIEDWLRAVEVLETLLKQNEDDEDARNYRDECKKKIIKIQEAEQSKPPGAD